MTGGGSSVTGTQSAQLTLTAAFTSPWLIVSPASARRIIKPFCAPVLRELVQMIGPSGIRQTDYRDLSH